MADQLVKKRLVYGYWYPILMVIIQLASMQYQTKVSVVTMETSLRWNIIEKENAEMGGILKPVAATQHVSKGQ